MLTSSTALKKIILAWYGDGIMERDVVRRPSVMTIAAISIVLIYILSRTTFPSDMITYLSRITKLYNYLGPHGLAGKTVLLMDQPLASMTLLILGLVVVAWIIGRRKILLQRRIMISMTAFIIVGFVISSIGYSAVFTYTPLTTNVNPTEPATTLELPSSGVSVSLGVNKTSASLKVTLSNTAQLLTNPDFYNNPDNWYYAHNSSSPNASLSAYWVNSDPNAPSSGGIIVINGNVTANGTTEWAWGAILQSVTFPNTTITNITIYARVWNNTRTQWPTYVISLVGLYDPQAQSFVSFTTIPQTSTYQNYTLSINPSQITPEKEYLVVVYINATAYYYRFLWLEFNGSVNVDFRVDSVYLYIQTAEYTFMNAILDVNTTKPVRAMLWLWNATGNLTGLNATVWIENINGTKSTPITIQNGAITNYLTNWTPLPVAPSGYHSATVYLQANSTSSNVNVTLRMYLVVSTGNTSLGAASFYPLTVNIDPPTGGKSYQVKGVLSSTYNSTNSSTILTKISINKLYVNIEYLNNNR